MARDKKERETQMATEAAAKTTHISSKDESNTKKDE